MAINFTPFFIPCDDAPSESLFCVYYPAVQRVLNESDPVNPAEKSAVLFIPPFAEEMNKSRRMFSLQANALANAGVSSLIVDLYGTGDSSGDFSEARWDSWVGNIGQTVGWLLDQGYSKISYIGLRLGGLLALDAANTGVIQLDKFVWWQPVLNGEIYLRQCLRLRAAQGMLSSGESKKDNTQMLYERMMEGENIELAGYEVHSDFGIALTEKRAAKFTACSNLLSTQIELIEMVSSEEKKNSPANIGLVEQWQAAGKTVTARVLVGDQFWSTREISVNPQLTEVTTSMFS